MTSDQLAAPGERPVRVLHLVSTFEIKTDTKWLLQLARRIDRRRFELSAACFHGGGPIRDRLDDLGVRTHNLHCPGELDPRSVTRAARLIRAGGYDVVHTHLLRADLYGGLAARLARTPVVVSTAYAVGEWRRVRKRRCDRLLDLVCARLPTHLLAVSNAVARDCARRLRIADERITVIHTGVDAPPVIDPGAAAAQRRAWNVPPGAPLVLTVARLSHEKGLDTLIDAWVEVVARRPDARLVVVGDGPDRGQLQSRIRDAGLSETILLAGFLPDVWPALLAADVFCLPSNSEGMPNALLEAMAAGRPIVATDVGGNPEAIEHLTSGLLVPSNDPRALADGLVQLIEDRELAERLGRAALETIERRFTAADVAGRYEALYERLLEPWGERRACAASPA